MDRTVPQPTLEGFDKFIKDTENHVGFWLNNHKEIVRGLIEGVAAERGWAAVTNDINSDGEVFDRVYKLIELSWSEARREFGKSPLDLDADELAHVRDLAMKLM